MSAAGRFAPSPTSDLHLGNLRTAWLAWYFARQAGLDFLLRIEDLDQQRVAAAPQVAERQLRDLRAIGLDWDGEVVRQSDRLGLYREAISLLDTYECFCTRREIAEAPRAPHSPPGSYPGTCRDLTESERDRRRESLGPGRQPALRLRSEVAELTVHDLVYGSYTGVVDDVVLRRGDGVWAYNLAVVVDDADQGVDQVVRGEDLLSSTPRQAYLADLLGITRPDYAHVPLVTGVNGERLSKREGAVTLTDLAEEGTTTRGVVARIVASLGGPEGADSIEALRGTLTLESIRGTRWVV